MSQNVLVLLCAAALAYPASGSAQTKSMPTSYVVKKGENTLTIAEAIRPPEATVNQMALALVRANVTAYAPKAEERLPEGTKLTVPDAKTVMATDAATAQREFGRIWRGEQHYKAGLALEKSNNMFHAFNAYTEAAKLGHALAQVRLGQLYDNDFSGFVQHDLQQSVRWYQKARATGVKVDKPGTRGGRTPVGG